MPVVVVLRVSCDAFGQKIGNLRKRCLADSEFEGKNVREAKIAAEEAGWCFTLENAKDKVFCPKHGPELRPHLYRKVSR